MLTALRIRAFRRLWLAGLISDIGDWMLMVSLPVLVYERTGSAAGTSIAFLLELVPGVVVTAPAGQLADRVNRRTLLICISLAQAAALLPLLASSQLPAVYAVIAAEAGLAAAFDPAKSALLPTLVAEDQLVSANTLVGLNQNLGRLIGGALGGVLLALGHLSVIAAVDAVSFLLAALLIAGVRAPSLSAQAKSAGTASRSRPFARRTIQVGLGVIAITAAGQGLFSVLFVLFVARSLHGGAAEIGLLRAVQAIGAIGGGLLLARFAHVRPGRLAGLACIVSSAIALATWNLPRITTAEAVYVALFIAFGVPAIAWMTGLISALQQATVDGERGRVFAAVGISAALGQALGIVAAGVLGDRLGITSLLDTQAALYFVAGLITFAWLHEPTARQRPQTETAEPAPGKDFVYAPDH